MKYLALIIVIPMLILNGCTTATTTLPAASDHAMPATTTSAAPGAVTRITVDDLAKMLAGPKDFTLVNVHIPYEGDLPKTDLSIDYDKIDQRLAELPAKDAKIVLYCRSGRMSDIAARRLAELGYTHIYDVTGGMLAWEASGRKLVSK